MGQRAAEKQRDFEAVPRYVSADLTDRPSKARAGGKGDGKRVMAFPPR